MRTFEPARTVLFVHGGNLSRAYHVRLALEACRGWITSPRGYDVYLLDLRVTANPPGRGAAEKPDANLRRAHRNGRRDIGAWWIHSRRRNIPRVVLLAGRGYVLGAPTRQHPDKVERLVLYAPIWIGMTGGLPRRRRAKGCRATAR